jgi:predicted RNA binding protein YcfA (HicA-like mRNA interferase family)
MEDRQRGSHLILIQVEPRARAVVPVHSGRTLKESLLRAILNDAKLSVEDFLQLR